MSAEAQTAITEAPNTTVDLAARDRIPGYDTEAAAARSTASIATVSQRIRERISTAQTTHSEAISDAERTFNQAVDQAISLLKPFVGKKVRFKSYEGKLLEVGRDPNTRTVRVQLKVATARRPDGLIINISIDEELGELMVLD